MSKKLTHIPKPIWLLRKSKSYHFLSCISCTITFSHFVYISYCICCELLKKHVTGFPIMPFVGSLPSSEILRSASNLCFSHRSGKPDFIFWITKESAGCRWWVEFCGRNRISVFFLSTSRSSPEVSPWLLQLSTNKTQRQPPGRGGSDRLLLAHYIITRWDTQPLGPVR